MISASVMQRDCTASAQCKSSHMSLLPAGKSATSHIQAHLEEARAPVPREAAPAAAPAAEPAANRAEPSGAAAPAAESAVDSAEPSGAALPAAEAEADPFNLDAIMEPPAPRRAAAPVLARLACPVVARWGACGVCCLGSDAAVSLRVVVAILEADCPS